MELKNIIEKLKNESVEVYRMYSPQSGGFTFLLREVYKSKNGKERFEYEKYIPKGLYLTGYYIDKLELTGVYYTNGKVYPIITNEDDYYGDAISITYIDGYCEDREKVFGDFLEENKKSYIIEDCNNEIYYCANTFFDGNTKENVYEFINTMVENGQNFKLIQDGKKYVKE